MKITAKQKAQLSERKTGGKKSQNVLNCCNGGEDSMNNPNSPQQAIMTFDEFLTDAHTKDFFQQVAEEIAQEQKEAVVVDSSVRRDEEWALLANQVVGRENCPLG